VQGAEIDEDVNQGITVGNGLVIAEFGLFDTQGCGLRIDTFVSSA